jgi:hypothetical protein
MSADPYVIRSQRNKTRKPAPADRTNGHQHGSEHKEAQGNGRIDKDYASRSKMMLVKPRHYLGYFSTG